MYTDVPTKPWNRDQLPHQKEMYAGHTKKNQLLLHTGEQPKKTLAKIVLMWQLQATQMQDTQKIS